MGILDSIKDMANKAVDTVKDVADDAQAKAAELKADFDEAGGAKGLFDKAGDQLSELGDNISDAAGKAVASVKETAGEAADGAKGMFDKASAATSEAASNAVDATKEAASDAVDAVKGEDAAPKA